MVFKLIDTSKKSKYYRLKKKSALTGNNLTMNDRGRQFVIPAIRFSDDGGKRRARLLLQP
jgi:hypothetical protein